MLKTVSPHSTHLPYTQPFTPPLNIPPRRYPVPQSGGSISIILIGMHILVPFRCQIHYSFILSACASLELFTMEIASCNEFFASIRTAFRILHKLLSNTFHVAKLNYTVLPFFVRFCFLRTANRNRKS